MFKKITALLIAVAILFSLIACTENVPSTDLESSDSESSSTTVESTTESDTNETESESETELGSDETSGEQSDRTPIKNLILIIGDGMGPEHIAAGQLGSGTTYDFTKWQNANVNTDSVSKSGFAGVLTDSAAGATALATGTLTYNGYLGMDHKQRSLETILDFAKANGKATGVITTDYLYGATPAGFSAHANSRSNYALITQTQANSGVDFLCGQRNDDHYLPYQSLLTASGYYFSNTISDLQKMPSGLDKLYLTLNVENSAKDSLPLAVVASMAISFLEDDEDGFVLIIEQAHIDKNAHNNNIDGVVSSVNSLAATVDLVMEWVGDRKDTAVLITADHETGGLTVSSEAVFADQYTSSGSFFYAFSSTEHTDQQVKLFVYGITPVFSNYTYYGSDYLIKNTDVFRIMKHLLDIEKQ